MRGLEDRLSCEAFLVNLLPFEHARLETGGNGSNKLMPQRPVCVLAGDLVLESQQPAQIM